MAQTATCTELVDVLNENECLENIPGMGNNVYIGLKSDLAAPLTLTGSTYSAPTFKSGKGLYKVEASDDTQQVQGSSAGYKGGFEITTNFAVSAVNEKAGMLARAANNLDIFIIVTDKGNAKTQILYDPNIKVKFDNGGIKTDTGAKIGDERKTTYEAKLSGVLYPNLYVSDPEQGWDSLLASKGAGG